MLTLNCGRILRRMEVGAEVQMVPVSSWGQQWHLSLPPLCHPNYSMSLFVVQSCFCPQLQTSRVVFHLYSSSFLYINPHLKRLFVPRIPLQHRASELNHAAGHSSLACSSVLLSSVFHHMHSPDDGHLVHSQTWAIQNKAASCLILCLIL